MAGKRCSANGNSSSLIEIVKSGAEAPSETAALSRKAQAKAEVKSAAAAKAAEEAAE